MVVKWWYKAHNGRTWQNGELTSGQTKAFFSQRDWNTILLCRLIGILLPRSLNSLPKQIFRGLIVCFDTVFRVITPQTLTWLAGNWNRHKKHLICHKLLAYLVVCRQTRLGDFYYWITFGKPAVSFTSIVIVNHPVDLMTAKLIEFLFAILFAKDKAEGCCLRGKSKQMRKFCQFKLWHNFSLGLYSIL